MRPPSPGLPRRRVLTALLLGAASVPVLGTGSAGATALREAVGYPNGKFPDYVLVAVGGIRLRSDAAYAYGAMLAAAAQDGASIAATDGYRSYERQVSLRAEKPRLAAVPGTSMHGYGLAVDFHMRRTDFAWLRANAARFGWVHPPWAQPTGSKPEPWHWEFTGVDEPAPLPVAYEPGDFVAEARFEPARRSDGDWFEIHHGLEGLEEGPGHYPGTAGPGQFGNFAVAGYHRDHGAPLRGLERLRGGDRVRVASEDGDEHVYEVVERDELGPGDGWAVGPDPLDQGADRMMTLTAGTTDDALLVVWLVAADADD